MKDLPLDSPLILYGGKTNSIIAAALRSMMLTESRTKAHEDIADEARGPTTATRRAEVLHF